jgi:hypothetical protein
VYFKLQLRKFARHFFGSFYERLFASKLENRNVVLKPKTIKYLQEARSHTMGNVQCVVPTVYDEDFDLKLAVRDKSAAIAVEDLWNCQSSSTVNDQPQEEPPFLRPHIRDHPNKVLLDHKQVMHALIEQGEERLRREREGRILNTCSLTSASSDESMQNSEHDAHNSISKTSSAFGSTEMTSFSDATRPIKNSQFNKRHDYDSGSKRHQHTSLPRQKEIDIFTDSDLLRRDIGRIIQRSNQNKGFMCGSERYEEPRGCGTTQLVRKNEKSNLYDHTIEEHVIVLDLKMSVKWWTFYKRHLLRRMPDDDLTLTISNCIENVCSDPLTTKKSQLFSQRIEALTSKSKHTDLEFGSGPFSSPIRLLATNSVFLDLSITGSLGLARTQRRPRCTLGKRGLKTPDQYIVLMNRRSGVPLVVCALKASAMDSPPIVRFYTTKQRINGQDAVTTTQKLGLKWCKSLPLYTWAEVVTEGTYPDRVRYSIHVAIHKSGKFEILPSYRAIHLHPGSPDILVVGKTEREKAHFGCAALSLCRDDNAVKEDTFLKVSICRGIDPALLICFAAFIDENMEATMKQYLKL